VVEGFYSIAFTGYSGSGFGMLVFHDGIAIGADVTGTTFDGTYVERPETQSVDFNITMAAPAGVTLVQTGAQLTVPTKVPIAGSFPMDLGREQPVLVQTALGPVNIILRRIRDFGTR
jgi:hypothetical protein